MSESGDTTRFLPIKLTNKWFVEYPTTEPKGWLRLGPAELDAEIGFKAIPWYECYDNTLLRLRIADFNGSVWESSIFLWTFHFRRFLVDLSRQEPLHFERYATQNQLQSLSERMLIEGFRSEYDDRFCCFPIIDDMVAVLYMKHQGAKYDIALRDEKTLLFRLSTLFCSWNRHCVPLPWMPPPHRPKDPEEPDDSDEGNYDNLPPLVFEVSLQNLLLNGSPLFPPFQQTKDFSNPQQGVAFRATPERHPQTVFLETHPNYEFLPVTWDLREDETLERYRGPFQFASRDGGILTFGKVVVNATYRLDFRQRQNLRDTLECRFRLHDEEGGIWEAESLFTPNVFFHQMIDMDSHDDPVFENYMNADNLLEFSENCIIRGVRDTIDNKSTHAFVVGGGEFSDLVTITSDWQRPVYNITKNYVKVSELVGRQYPVKIEWSSEYLATEIKPEHHVERVLPPIYYKFRPISLIFRNTTHAVDDGFWHDNDLPIPLVFRRIPGKGEPQPGVIYHPPTEI